jgi:glycosyltransferase involved in cell wall biosynthesis
MSKVSVIIPVFNVEPYLRRCLNSVVNQTLSDIEIICVNDCSHDNSLEILKEYAAKDSRIKIIDFPENKGAAVARNTAMGQVCGEYIGFVDSDDFIDLDFYEKLYVRANETGADAVKSVLMTFDNNTQTSNLEQCYDLNDKIKKNQAYFYYTFTSAIYKTSFIFQNKIDFPKGLIYLEDPCFTIKAGFFYNKIAIVDDAKYYYVNNKNSVTRTKSTDKHLNSLVAGANHIINMLNNYNIDKTHYMIVFNFVTGQLLDWCSNGNVNDVLNNIAIKGLIEIYKQCRYQEECLQFYFLEKKRTDREFIIKQLRNNVRKIYAND